LKRFLIVLAAVLAVAVVGAAVAVNQARQYLDTPLNVPPNGLRHVIPAGTPFATVCENLAAEGVLGHCTLLRWYARWTGDAGKIQAGEYLIAAGTTPDGLLRQFTSGAVVLHSFTLVEGWNHRELLAQLQRHPEVESTMTGEDWPALLEALGAAHESPEGLFLPETYHFPRGTEDRSVLTQAYRLMQSALAEEWAARDESVPASTPYEALILASIIEKETGRADERHRIAGVIVRRLQRNMRLQMDPTVIYGIGPSFDGNLTRKHLRTDTPYNTYTRAGLPPTPIAMPGRAAIHAALHPADGEELYFVATGLGDGSHRFSVTVEEHEKAVREYLRRLRGRGK